MNVVDKQPVESLPNGGTAVVNHDDVFGKVRRVKSADVREYYIGQTQCVGKSDIYLSCNVNPLTRRVMVSLAGSSIETTSESRPMEPQGLVPSYASAHFTPEQMRKFAEFLIAAADEADSR